MNKVKVNNDLTSYLPGTTETRQGLDLMEEQFITYGTARVMVCNVTYQEAEQLAERMEEMDGVSMLDFEDTEDYIMIWRHSSRLPLMGKRMMRLHWNI